MITKKDQESLLDWVRTMESLIEKGDDYFKSEHNMTKSAVLKQYITYLRNKILSLRY